MILRPMLCNGFCEIEYSRVDSNGHFILDKLISVCPRHAAMNLSDKEIADKINEESDLHNEVIAVVSQHLPNKSITEIGHSCKVGIDGIMNVGFDEKDLSSILKIKFGDKVRV